MWGISHRESTNYLFKLTVKVLLSLKKQAAGRVSSVRGVEQVGHWWVMPKDGTTGLVVPGSPEEALLGGQEESCVLRHSPAWKLDHRHTDKPRGNGKMDECDLHCFTTTGERKVLYVPADNPGPCLWETGVHQWPVSKQELWTWKKLT